MSRRERELWAYLDRELAARPRERLEERLTPRSEEQAELDRMGELSSAIRASWSQGPRAPAAEFVGAKVVGYDGPQAYIDALETFQKEIG